ncbi:hypothetical protein D9611_013188 [Ephemerocybe angulata]|uniref:Derlin n=1 Tax=Ephemerocybe angulata TaxID=980116 RepID=A0A8H5F9X9_9AGAR|nr:hypothetical protein D9611_013188 [Tulosesus angulatus]
MPTDLENIVKEVQKISPVAKFACASTLGLTLLVRTNPWRYQVPMMYSYYEVFKRFQLWKLWTSFFLGTPNLNLLYEVAILYRSITALESGPFRQRSSDLAWQLFFACAGIFAATRPLDSNLFILPLTTCLCYIAGATAPSGSNASFMGVLTLPVETLPYLTILLALILGGPRGAAQATAGAVVGCIWFFLIWKARGEQGVLAKQGQAPDWLRNVFGERKQPINGGGLKKGGKVGEGITLALGATKSCCGGQRGAAFM